MFLGRLEMLTILILFLPSFGKINLFLVALKKYSQEIYTLNLNQDYLDL